ncbi:MAG: DsbA family protein, partial [Burkholderiales bacterium]
VPLSIPPRFPVATHNAARVFWYLKSTDAERAVDWAHSGLRAYFARGVDPSDNAALEALAQEFGLAPGIAELVWSDPRWKLQLKQENDAAIAAGVFGAPFFVVDGEPFWGNDRRTQIERWLEQGPF